MAAHQSVETSLAGDRQTLGAGAVDGGFASPSVAVVLARLDALGRLACLGIGLAMGLGYGITGVHNADAGMFWDTGQAESYYSPAWDSAAVYLYPPPLAQIVGSLPWAAFIVPWMLLLFGSFWYALRWLSVPVIVVGVIWFASGRDGLLWSPLAQVVIGNPQPIVAAAIVAGFRHPAAWAVVLLTKIGPGVGLMWFAVRREWRSLWVVAMVTLLLASVSLLLGPRAWLEFADFAMTNAGATAPIPVVPVPFAVRLAMALPLVAWGAHTGRRWTVPVAAAWSAIALYEWSFALIWLSAVPLWWERRQA